VVENKIMSGELVACGNFGKVTITVSNSVSMGTIGLPEELKIEADIIGIARSGEALVAWKVDKPECYSYAGERVECWIRLDDGKCEISKHWVRPREELERLIKIWEENQPVADVIEMGDRKRDYDA
jgi:hypothetical protein